MCSIAPSTTCWSCAVAVGQKFRELLEVLVDHEVDFLVVALTSSRPEG